MKINHGINTGCGERIRVVPCAWIGDSVGSPHNYDRLIRDNEIYEIRLLYDEKFVQRHKSDIETHERILRRPTKTKKYCTRSCSG